MTKQYIETLLNNYLPRLEKAVEEANLEISNTSDGVNAQMELESSYSALKGYLDALYEKE